MKDLVYILPDKDAGVASVIRNLLRYKSSGYKATIILLHNKSDDAVRRCEERSFNADLVVRIAYNPKIHSKFRVLKMISKHLNRNSVLVANDGHFDLDVLRYTNIKLPTVYIMHGDSGHYHRVIKEKSDLMGRIITVSDYLKQKVQKLLLESHSEHFNLKVESIKFPVPTPSMNFEHKLDSAQIRLVFVGSLIEAKGVNELKAIVLGLEEHQIKYTLNIIGSGKEEEQLRTHFREHKAVQFLGKLSNAEVIASHLNHDIILLPSKGEGLPVVIVEAMKCGVIPMVTNLNSGIPELIEHGVNGFTIDLKVVHKYADYIKELNDDRNTMKSMGIQNIVNANQLFDPFFQTKAYELAFNEAHPVHAKIAFIKKIMAMLPMHLEHRLVKLISL